MAAALEILATVPFGGAVLGGTVLGLVWQLLITFAVFSGAYRTMSTASEVERIALSGEPERARVQARTRQALAPLLATLSGEARPDLTSPWFGPAVGTVAVALPPALVLLVGRLGFLPPLSHLALIASSGLLVPSGLLSARAIVLIGRSASRRVRQACVQLLEGNARASVDADRVHAARARSQEAFGE